MRPLKLHEKNTLLTSVVILVVLIVMVVVKSSRVSQLLRDEQKARAEYQAVALADHISLMPTPRDLDDIRKAADFVKNARPGTAAIRVWERTGGLYRQLVEASGSLPLRDIPEETVSALRSGLPSHTVRSRDETAHASTYRVFAPVTTDGRLSGAVELVETLDETPAGLVEYRQAAAWISLGALVLITAGTYLLFNRFVYRPIDGLVAAMSRVKRGDLTTRAETRTEDELGVLARDFNAMIERLQTMTEAEKAQKDLLAQRVEEATTELRGRNAQLERANFEIRQVTRRLTAMEGLAAAGQTAAQFAHEVGTPLNLISGHVQLLRTRLADDERSVRRLDTIAAQIERIERIVRGMLDRTRPAPARLEPLDLNTVIRQVSETAFPWFEAARVNLETDLSETLPPIDGNADQLQQVFINLFNNALDAMPDGGTLTVKTTVKPPVGMESPASVAVSVTDTGVGMADETRRRIFDPLFTTKPPGRGTGLGLGVVRQFVREHRGEIRAESAPGKGATFFLRFPVSPATTALAEAETPEKREFDIKNQ